MPAIYFFSPTREFKVTRDDVCFAFAQFGDVRSVDLKSDFGFVHFATENARDNALDAKSIKIADRIYNITTTKSNSKRERERSVTRAATHSPPGRQLLSYAELESNYAILYDQHLELRRALQAYKTSAAQQREDAARLFSL